MSDAENSLELAADVPFRFRRGLAIASVAIGLLCVVLAWVLGVMRNPFGFMLNPFGLRVDATNAQFWSGLLVNVGTTVLLAFLLIVFERAIVTTVRKENAVVVEKAEARAGAKAAAVVDEKTTTITNRLDALQAEIQKHAADSSRARRTASSKIVEDPTFEAIGTAIVEAHKIGALISKGSSRYGENGTEFVVAAGDGLDAPRVRVDYGEGPERRQPTIVLTPLVGGNAEHFEWKMSAPVAGVLKALHDSLIAQGAAAGAKLYDAKVLLENISAFLDAATAGRQDDPDAWVSKGPSYELIAPGWMVTDRGIEVRGHGLLVPRKAFGTYARGYSSQSNRVTGADIPAAPPGDLDQDTYKFAIQRASRFLLGDPFPNMREH